MKNLLIIIPAYNEEENLRIFLDQVLQEPICEMADILVIDDGSSDRTREVAVERGVRVVTHLFNLGYGCALQTGYKYAVQGDAYEYLIQIDADGQHDSSNLESIYQILKSGAADIVIGSRFLSEKNKLKPSFVKLLAIRQLRYMIRLLARRVITDPTSGLQGMNRAAFTYNSHFNNLFHEYPDANLLLQLLLNHFNVHEIGAVMYPRESGKSMHAGLKPIAYMATMFLSIFVVYLREHCLKKKK